MLPLCDPRENTLVALSYVCAVCQSQHTCGELWQLCTHIWKCSGHQHQLLPRSALQLEEQRFPLGMLCVLSVQQWRMCLIVSWESIWLLVSDLLPVCCRSGSWVTETTEIRTKVLASGKGKESSLSKVHLAGEAGMLCVQMCSSAGHW